MGLLRLSGFSGMWPIRDPRALPDNAAVLARNMMDEGGAYLKGARAPSLVKTLLGTTRTVFRIPLAGANTLVNSFWMEFADENTSVFRGSLVNDQYERFYWASPSEVPKYAPKSTITAGGAGFILGVIPPAVAPSLTTIVGGTGPDETRSYLATFVNVYGEESQPSDTVTSSGNTDGTWNMTVPQPPAAGGYAAFNVVRIYRTVTSAQGLTDFYKVVDLPVGTLSFGDAVLAENLTEVLESTTWAIPETGLQGLAKMPNGIFVSWKDNKLFFSENYRPHAWPAEYGITVDYPIVGVGVFGNSLAVCTTGSPAIVSGTKASAMSLQKTDAPLACLSRRSIVSAAEGVYYSSEDGLVLVGPAGVQVVTSELISREQWRTVFGSASIKGMYQNGQYTGIRTIGAVTDMFRFKPSDPSTQGVGYHDRAALNIGIEPWTGKPWIIDSDNKLYEWDAPGAAHLSYTWQSREFIYPQPTNFAAFQAYFDDTSSSILHLKIWATLRGKDGRVRKVLVYDEDVHYSGRELRLPSGFKSDIWQFEFSGTAELQAFQIATTAAELRRA
jgi:hypothetical protein